MNHPPFVEYVRITGMTAQDMVPWWVRLMEELVVLFVCAVIIYGLTYFIVSRLTRGE